MEYGRPRFAPAIRGLALAALLLAPGVGWAADVRIISPNIIYSAGLTELIADYNRTPGRNAILVRATRAKILDDIRTATPPADVIALPAEMLEALARDGGVAPGSLTPLGRGEMGLAVRKGAPKPDISSVAKLAAVLKGAKAVMVNDPKGGTAQGVMIEAILRRPEFQDVRVAPATEDDGVTALARGEGEMAIQLVQDILAIPELELVGPLPAELGGHMDAGLAVSARSADPRAAMDFIRFLTGPAARATWQAKGLSPF